MPAQDEGTALWATARVPTWRARAPLVYIGSGPATVVLLYGLMVIVTVPFTELPWVSVTWIRKLKVPAWVGVPVRTLL